MPGQAGDQGIRSALDEFLLPPGPLINFLLGQRGFFEQMHAHLVADVPGVDVYHPILHLCFGQLIRLSDHPGHDHCLRDARIP